MGIEIQATRHFENVLCVEVRPSVNLTSIPIEEVIAKMQRSHIKLIDLLETDLRYAGVPPRAIQPLASLKLYAESREPSWFNSTTNFEQATSEALTCASSVFKYLTAKVNEETTLELEPPAIFESARLAAQAGCHQHAVDLLLLWVKRKRRAKPEDEEEKEGVPIEGEAHADDKGNVLEDLKHILRELLKIGCQNPWPHTVAELASTKKVGEPHSDYEYKTDCLSREAFLEVTREALKEREDLGLSPFRRGAKVLVKIEPGEQWRPATIQMRYADGDPKRADGYLWKVKVPGMGALSLPEEAVLADSEGGLAAVLRAAAQTGNKTVVEWLLELGPRHESTKAVLSLYETDKDANTAITLAASVRAGERHAQDAAKVVKLLLDSEQGQARHDKDAKHKWKECEDGPLADVRNNKLESAYDLSLTARNVHARRQIKPSTFDKLLSGPLKKLEELDEEEQYCQLRLAKDSWDNDGNITKEGQITSLMLACKLGNKKAVERLLEKKADVHIKTKGREVCTALCVACEEGVPEIVKLLLQANANANELDASTAITRSSDDQAVYQRTPLIYACDNGHHEVVRMLLGDEEGIEVKTKANVNAVFKGGRTVLMSACHHGFKRCVEQLIKHKADVNAVDQRNGTPLMWASRFGHTSTARLLIERKADVEAEIEKSAGWTSLHRACAGGHAETAREVINGTSDIPKLLAVKDKQKSRTPLLVAATVGSHT